MQKQAWTWTTPRLPLPARMVRWGHFGTPVLIFPTAGGDFEEIERFQLVAALGALIDGGRIKVYSVDAIAMRAWLAANTSMQDRASLDGHYDSFLYEDVLQRIRVDCQDARIEPILVGASLGAATALGTLCRHPDVFRAAIGLSGGYGGGYMPCECSGVAASKEVPAQTATSRATPRGAPSLSAIDYVGTLDGAQLEQLKHRRITLGTGSGDYDDPNESKRFADALGATGIACRITSWGPERDHTWSTWRDQLPALLEEQL